MEYASEDEHFDDLVDKAKSKLQLLPQIVEEAIYYEDKEEYLPYPEAYDDTKKGYLKEAVDSKMLSIDDDNEIRVNYDHPKLREIRMVINNLRYFLERMSSRYKDQMEKKYGFTFALDDKQFWDKFLF